MTEINPQKVFNRQSVLEQADNLQKKLYSRLSLSRFRSYETDGEMLKMLRGYVALLTVMNQISRDDELRELEARVSEIEKQQKVTLR